MSVVEANIHATAIVVGTTGLLFVGPSGAGKSTLAFACLNEAKALGLFAALVADDRVLVSRFGEHVLARCPSSIAGLLELRHTGIVEVGRLPSALMQIAASPVHPATSERLPPESERFPVVQDIALPLVRLPLGVTAPFSFVEAVMMAQRTDCPRDIAAF